MPWTRRRSILLAAAFWRSWEGVSGSVLGRPSVRGLAFVAAAVGFRILPLEHDAGPALPADAALTKVRMVGLDVRLAIGEYLCKELGNAAFEPPALMRHMVAEGRLGKKARKGFYEW